MALVISTYFKAQEQKQNRNETLKLYDSPSLKLSQRDISLTIKDVYNELIKSQK